MPQKSPQAKAKSENCTNGEVVRFGRTVLTVAKIGLSGKGKMLSRGGGNCHCLLGVVADDNDDKLFTERAMDITEICMKERAGNCEQRELCNAVCTPTADRQSLAGLDAGGKLGPGTRKNKPMVDEHVRS